MSVLDIFSPERNTTSPSDWSVVYDVVRYIQLIMALLSVVGSGFIICCVMSQRTSRRRELHPLLLLCVSDLLLALCWLLGAALFSEHSSSLGIHCYNVHTLEQVLYMVSFFCTLNYMWNLYSGLTEKLRSCFHGYSVQFSNRVSTAGKTTALLSCLTPLLLMTPVFIHGNISRCQGNVSQPYRCLLMDTGALFLTSEGQQPIRSCRLLRGYAMYTFFVTFILTLVGVTTLVFRARSVHRRVVASAGYLGSVQRASLRVIGWRMLLFPLVFVVCWGPAAMLAFLRVVTPSTCQGGAGVVLYVLQTLTSGSQGFFNSLVYGWTHLRLRHTRVVTRFRDVDTQTPLLPSQKNATGKRRSYRALS